MHAQFGKVALLFAGLISLVAIPAIPAQSAGSAQEVWGATSGGLRMSISTAEPGNGKPGVVELTVALQNVSEKDLVLNLGMMVGNGSALEPTAIKIVLTNPGGDRQQPPFSSRIVVIAGRVDDFVVGLPVGGTYVLTRTLDRLPFGQLSPGRYRVAARFEGNGPIYINLDTPGMRLLHFWTGTVLSNTAEFEMKN